MRFAEMIWRGAAAMLAALALWPVPLCAAEIAKHTLPFEGQTRSYYAYPPATLSAGEAAPLVVLLHGSGRDGHAIIRLWKADADARGLVLVAPNALHNSA